LYFYDSREIACVFDHLSDPITLIDWFSLSLTLSLRERGSEWFAGVREKGKTYQRARKLAVFYFFLVKRDARDVTVVVGNSLILKKKR